MEENKDINLMPEDLRSKEAEILAKKKDEFQPDLVVPEKLAKQKKSKASGSGEPFLAKLGKLFKRKPVKKDKPKSTGQSILAQEVKSKKKHKEEKPKEHKPKKEKHKVKVIQEDLHLPDLKPEKKEKKPKVKKPKGPSLWSKLSGLLKKKPKKYNPKSNGQSILSMAPVNGKKEPVKAPPAPEPVKEVPVPKPPEEPKKSDFSIPEPKKPKEKPKSKKKKKGQKGVVGFHKPESRIRAKFISEGGGVDLIPTAVRTRSWRQIVNLLLLSFFGSIIIIGLFYLALFLQEKNIENRKSNRDKQISDLERQILTYEEFNNDIATLGNQIKSIHGLLHEHVYWTNFFILLERYTLEDVHYTGFAASNGGALTLHAVGDSFDSAAKQLKVLQQTEVVEKFVKQVDISAAKASSLGVEFDIVVVLNDDLFYYDEDILEEDEEDNEDEE